MQLADAERALRAELDSNRLGVPVALRIHAMLPAVDRDILDAIGFFRPFLSLIGDITRGTIQAKRHASGKQCTILWTAETGKTAFLTLIQSPDVRQSLHVLMIGNHGAMQLQGGETWNDALSDFSPLLWEKEIQESLRNGTSIRATAS